jgi:hypothetical protein
MLAAVPTLTTSGCADGCVPRARSGTAGAAGTAANVVVNAVVRETAPGIRAFRLGLTEA